MSGAKHPSPHPSPARGEGAIQPVCEKGRMTKLTRGSLMNGQFSFRRTFAVARKEFLHIIRDPATLFFAVFIPILELFMLGYAIDTNVRFVATVVLDQCQTQESERLVRTFVNSKDF